MIERVAIAGTGAIARGLAQTAARLGDVTLLARSSESARYAAEELERRAETDPAMTGRVRTTTDPDDLARATLLVEAVVEDLAVKANMLATLSRVASPEALVATTTSSLSITELSITSGRRERFFGLHVFNPVAKMELVELIFPTRAGDETRERAHAFCEALGKTAVEVPDTPGFVVNRLLFPYLFSAIELLEESDMTAAQVDQCMTLGTGHPMGPLALLDFVGLDVALAIGRTLDRTIPRRLRDMVEDGDLGRKAGRGFHKYPGERK